jgi:DmsE family decaheme c-type cytochrome
MKITQPTIRALLILLAGLVWQPVPTAQAAAKADTEDAAETSTSVPGPDAYSEKGADTCLKCHDEESDTPTFTTAGIFKSRHGMRGDKRTPFGAGGLQCEACHGPGGRHSSKGGGKKTLTINSQKKDSFLPVAKRNEACLSCHEGGLRTGWHAGAHERNQVACTDCHRLHVRNDPVMARASQPDVCFKCHKQQRADFQKASTHPVRFGLMGCSDCHNPHGSTNVALLIKPTINQTCYSCHAEKRGPLLWEHAPVAEDCSLCHATHGSVRNALLKKSPPLLCQQCHSVAGHPSVARTGAALPGNGGTGAIYVIAGACTNCHTQVHGSNHPAGAKLMR